MRLLVFGGTGFLGRHIVEAARSSNHDLTLADRGITAPDLFPELERLRGEREHVAAKLKGRWYDAIVDAAGFGPVDVEVTARVFRRTVANYVFVSSVSAYKDLAKPGLSEVDALGVGRSDYGGRKARAEEALAENWPGSSMIVRPGVLAGPGDPTGRFAFWPLRVARGGTVLVPGPRTRPIQYVDVRDLAGWLMKAIERRLVGTFNAVGPAYMLTAEAFLTICRDIADSDARLVWVDPHELVAHAVEPWRDLPFWTGDRWAGLMQVDGAAARAAGLSLRPVEETIQDTMRWALQNPQSFPRRGLSPEAEAALLTSIGGIR